MASQRTIAEPPIPLQSLSDDANPSSAPRQHTNDIVVTTPVSTPPQTPPPNERQSPSQPSQHQQPNAVPDELPDQSDTALLIPTPPLAIPAGSSTANRQQPTGGTLQNQQQQSVFQKMAKAGRKFLKRIKPEALLQLLVSTAGVIVAIYYGNRTVQAEERCTQNARAVKRPLLHGLGSNVRTIHERVGPSWV
ncbi:hypothetical protein FQN50_000875 [Emmonsiellopsis sp. PD_5]|nr:hypothetical protein FQN50_000875 [Emmonsiellopsis sp. PD_5]